MAVVFVVKRNKWRPILLVVFGCFLIWIIWQIITKRTICHRKTVSQSSVIPISHSFEFRRLTLSVVVVSSKNRFAVQIDDRIIVDDQEPKQTRGLHVVVIDNANGYCTSYRVFDTYLPGISDTKLVPFLKTIPDGRTLIIGVKDEGSFHLGDAARKLFIEWGSSNAENFDWRDMWIFAVIRTPNGPSRIGESFMKAASYSEWAAPAVLHFKLETDPSTSRWNCSNQSYEKVRHFCERTDGYPEICRCENPESVGMSAGYLPAGLFVTEGKLSIPVAVIASNRPFYLQRMLRTLLDTAGVNPQLITVFVDGMWDEAVRVTQLYSVAAVQHVPGGHSNARISQHYRASLSALFAMHSSAAYAVILEEDLEVSPDFFSYIAQTVPLLEKDSSLYCISAWNDLGYEHTVGSPQLLYRVETMPGLGWVISRKLFIEELKPQWPPQNRNWDWDMWMRSAGIRRGRECIIPDVSRTYHFGASGLNMNPVFQDIYFERHATYRGRIVQLDVSDLTEDAYERKIHDLLLKAVPVDHSVSPCQAEFFPVVPDKTLSVFIRMDNASDFTTWLEFCRCLKIWDLDQRGSHFGLWRFFARPSQPVIVVGVPGSSYSKLKPSGLFPIDLTFSPKKSSS